MARWTAAKLNIPEEQVLVASTGVIGEPLDVEKVRRALPELINTLDVDGISVLAEAIMTTDTVPKVVTQKGRLGDAFFTVTGVAKGAGMIRPDMATLLCFVVTDVAAEPELLKEMLATAADRTLNRITVDGDTSTNDTALLIASGLSGVVIGGDAARKEFQGILDAVLMSLARKLIRDGEGATKLVEIAVKGARSDADAYQIADTVAHSNLVKTALFGEDANWGRILAAAGRAGVPIQSETMDIYFADVLMVKSGMGCGKKAEARATQILKQAEYTITIDLKGGTGTSSVITCDFSIDYVKINADYRS
jgi:glutamate N-acetyltransferase/amino-acid N-acetyltransferase